MRKFFIILSLVITPLFSFGQKMSVRFEGVITNQDLSKKEAGVTVQIIQNGGAVASGTTASNGKYTLSGEVDHRKPFEIVYSKNGMVSKKVAFDLKNLNQEDTPPGDFAPLTSLDLELFNNRPGVDFGFLERDPIAKFDLRPGDIQLKLDQGASAAMKKKVDDLLKSAAEKEKANAANFSKIVAEANKLYDAKNYDAALVKYEEAAKIEAKDKHVNTRINEIYDLQHAKKEAALADKQKNQEYYNLIQAGDNLYKQGDLEKAKARYKEASMVNEDEDYPLEQIKKINKEIKQKEEEAKYKQLVEAADIMMKQKSYKSARDNYENAGKLRPTEAYPKEQITKIDNLLKGEEEAADKKKKYEEAIAEADNAYNAENWAVAKDKYSEALTLEAASTYAKGRKADVEAKIAAAEAEKKKLEQVNKLLKEGDDFVTKTSYQEALGKYNEALKLDDKNQTIKDKIANANQLMVDAQKAKDLQAKYDATIKDADLARDAKKYDEAIAKYTVAQGLMDKPYPTEQIDMINKIKADEKAAADKAAADKAEAERLAKEAADKAAAEKAEQERLAKEAAEKAAAERAEAERLAKEAEAKAAAEKAEKERLAKEAEAKAAAEKAEKERLAKEEAERLAKEAADKAAAEKAEQERLAKEAADKAAAEKAEQERLAKEAAEKAEKERLAKEEAERLAKEAADKAAAEKAEQERLAKEAAEKAAAERAEAERLAKEAADKAASDKAEKERLAKEEAERLAKEAADKAAAEKAEQERLAKEAADKAAVEIAEQERLAKEAADKAAAERAEAERLAKEAADKAASEKSEAERLAKEAADKAAAEKAEQERLAKEAAEKAAAERAEAERLAKEAEAKAAAEKAEKERLAKEEAERLAKEAVEKAASERSEAERLAKEAADKAAAERAEAERLAKEEAEKAAAERAEAERLAKEAADKAASDKAEKERLAKEEAERLAKEAADKAAAEKAEQERLAKEAADKAAVEIAEQERLAKEAADKAAAERAEAERLAKEAADKAASDKAEQERLAKEAADKAAAERAEAERLAKEAAEKAASERSEAEKLAKEAADKAASERFEAERLAKEAADKAAAERAEAERLAKEAAEKAASERSEAERLAKEAADKAAAERAEAERLAKEAAEKAASERSEAEKLAKEAADKAAAERAEQERLAKIAGDKAAAEKAEKDRIAREMAEKAAAERAEAERLERETSNEIQRKKNEAQQEKIDKEYQSLLAKGDALVEQKKYAEAIESFNSALNLKPDESLPVQKARAAQDLSVKDQNEANQAFEKLITAIETKINEEDFTKARDYITRANSIRSNDPRPSSLLKQVERLEKEHQQYLKNMQDAETKVKAEQYTEAIVLLMQAKDLKPKKAEPQKRIDEINELIAQQANVKSAEAQFNQVMALGKAAEEKKVYMEALKYYKRAKELRSDDGKVIAKIAEVEAKMAQAQQDYKLKKAKDDHFNGVVKTADDAFNSGDYQKAVAYYGEAKTLRPDNTYVKGKYDEAVRMNKIDSNKEMAGQYAKIIALADENFNAQNWDRAQEYYQRASDLKKSDEYPKRQLEIIQNILNPPTMASPELSALGEAFDPSVNPEFALLQADAKRKDLKVQKARKVKETAEETSSAETLQKRQEQQNTLDMVYQFYKDAMNGDISAADKKLIEMELIKQKEQQLAELGKRNEIYKANENIRNQDLITQEQQRFAYSVEAMAEGKVLDLEELERIRLAAENERKSSEARSHQLNLDNKQKHEQLAAKVGLENEQSREVIEDTRNLVLGKEAENTETVIKGADENYQKAIAGKLQVEQLYGKNEAYTNDVNEAKIQTHNQIATTESNATKTAAQNEYDKMLTNRSSKEKLEELEREKAEREAQLKEAAQDNEQFIIAKNREVAETENLQKEAEKQKYLSQRSQVEELEKKKSSIQQDADEELRDKDRQVKILARNQQVEETAKLENRKQEIYNTQQTIAVKRDQSTQSQEQGVDAQRANQQKVADINKTATMAQTSSEKEKAQSSLAIKNQLDRVEPTNTQTVQIKNTLGEKYPEGVSQEMFQRKDENGLPVAIITRRVVVIEGKGVEYIKTQTVDAITYTKSGTAITEYVWQKETNNAALKRHF